MISVNLNAIDEWERVRRDTEPETPDVERTPESDRSSRTELERASRRRFNQRPPRRNRRGRGEDRDGGEATDEDTGSSDEEHNRTNVDPHAPDREVESRWPHPPRSEHAPLEPWQATIIDIDA